MYCGSSFGSDPVYLDATSELARTFAGRGIRVVYGGASVGLMGALADATLAAGGEVVGVIPQQLVDREIAHHGLTELHVVQTMHQRKALMAELSDAFVALPGGIGTLEELIEVFTWEQLGCTASRSACSTPPATTTGWRRSSTTPSRRASTCRSSARSWCSPPIPRTCWPSGATILRRGSILRI